MHKLLLAVTVLLTSFLALSAQDSDKPPTPAERDAANKLVVAAQLPSYPLDTCVVSGKDLGSKGTPINHVVDGRLVRLCCKGCVSTADKAKDSIAKKIEEAVVLAQRPIYPLDTCVVSGEKLGAMGDIIDHVDGTRLVRFCCGGCVKAYAKDPAKFLAQVDAALIEKLRATYPLKVCAVSGEPLDAMGGPVDKLYGVQLVRLCCEGCVSSFEKDPRAVLKKIAEGAKPRTP